jgi:trehalose 6-phosphate synthase/phosphatase
VVGVDETGNGGRLRALLGDRQLVVVSNREPLIHSWRRGRIAADHPSGGLVAALGPVLEATSGTWIAWGSGDADFVHTDASGRIGVPPGAPRYVLRRLALSRAEAVGYYYGYANQVLWPLCHMALEKIRFRTRFWEVYQAVNRRFASAVLEEAREDSIVWIHDYHLAVCPRDVRRARPGVFLMHFWHIPWPGWDVFRACPCGELLLDGLLASDLLAFQHPSHVRNFLECAEQVGARVNPEAAVVEFRGHSTTVRCFPISVDYGALRRVARSSACGRWMSRFAQRLRLEGRQVIVGVDRLDYTKGILERLRAFGLLLRHYPQYRSRVVLVLKCAPSRTEIRAYRDLLEHVRAAVSRVNALYGTADWCPVVCIPRPLPPAAMAALYRGADVCIVSSLQDGMNLVAKEFLACQVDQKGVLVLSDLAGARRELPDALGVNPYDAEGMMEALARALRLSPAERQARLRRLQACVEARDVYAWVEDHLALAARLLAGRTAPRTGERAGEGRAVPAVQQ